MDHQLNGEYNRIVLKPLNLNNIEDLRLLRNREENRICFIYSDIISKQQQKKWYDNYLGIPNDYMFSVFLKHNPKEYIGSAAIYNIDEVNKTAEYGRIVIDKSKTNEKGLGVEITLAVCDIAYNNLNLNVMYLEVYENNFSAIKTYERAGFIKFNEKVINSKKLIVMKKLKQ